MKQILKILKLVISDVFGNMFFMFPEIPDEIVNLEKKWMKFRVKISGEKTFHLSFYFTESVGRKMTENYLGEDADGLNQTIISETLKEATNVMGGNVLNELEKDFKLGIPEECPVEKNLTWNKEEGVMLLVEAEPFMVTVSMDEKSGM